MFGMARRSDKRASNPPIKAIIEGKDQGHDVYVLDISRKGLRFSSSDQYQIGDKLTFGFSKGDSDISLSLSIKGKVVNDYGPGTGDMYEYGVKFSSLLHWYEMNCIHDFVYAIIRG